MANDATICLLSGGLASAVAAAISQKDQPVFGLTVTYGAANGYTQLTSAIRIAAALKLAGHKHLHSNLSEILRNPIVDSYAQLPTNRVPEMARKQDPVSSLRDGRFFVFLAIAAAFARKIGANRIVTGITREDKDVLEGEIDGFPAMFRLSLDRAAFQTNVDIWHPFIDQSLSDVVRTGLENKVRLELTSNCYFPERNLVPVCGRCDACVVRANAFHKNRMNDPATKNKIEWR